MKRRGLWAACVLLLLLGVGVLAVGTGFAKDENAKGEDDGAKCSEATLHGMYLAAYDGVEITGNDQVPLAVAGHDVFNGNGKVVSVFTANLNGEIVFSKEEFSGKYTVKADCTGTLTYPAPLNVEMDLFIAPDGSIFTFVQTKPPEQVASGFELRGTAERVGD
jgi:hypothetical protein